MSQSFVCPICRYRGPFDDFDTVGGVRSHACCPKCGAKERHRVQFLVLERLARRWDFSRMDMLHFAPELFLQDRFPRMFRRYLRVDLERPNLDCRVDMRRLPFPDGSWDFVYASHVLEHIRDDRRALREIRRVLRPGGVAVLPVPITAETTIEFPAPDPEQWNHVRAPGKDYFDRYREVFAVVEEYDSTGLPAEHQPFVIQRGKKGVDVVPVCLTEGAV